MYHEEMPVGESVKPDGLVWVSDSSHPPTSHTSAYFHHQAIILYLCSEEVCFVESFSLTSFSCLKSLISSEKHISFIFRLRFLQQKRKIHLECLFRIPICPFSSFFVWILKNSKTHIYWKWKPLLSAFSLYLLNKKQKGLKCTNK